jgi:hypothetical protein
MKHRTVAGTILYTSRKPERLGEARGVEHFRFTHHHDGKVTLRAYCEIEDPDPTVLRDIVYSLDEHGAPMDCHVRVTVGDQFMGSGWFRFSRAAVECESFSPDLGRVSQRVPLDEPLDGFVTHPVVSDGYLLSRLDWSVGQRRTLNMMLPSPDHRGASPPMIAWSRTDARYDGLETITVAAGTFEARKFAFLDERDVANPHPPFEVWLTNDADAVLLQGGVGGYMQTWYELMELSR